MSSKLAPSKSTVYISNFPFSLTNNDLHKLVEKHGRPARVTVLKDRQTRRSRGVAFVLFAAREEAAACAHALDGRQLFGRTLKASLARDNGRAAEFIRRREYPDKSNCYECGEAGHMSYSCPKNALGDRPPPPKKPRKRRPKGPSATAGKAQAEDGDEEDDEGEDPREESLAAAIEHQQRLVESQRQGAAMGEAVAGGSGVGRRKVVRDGYFSDEEQLED